jgi:hypothetical protein
MTNPGWILRVCEHESGAQVIGCDPSTGAGIIVRPKFRDTTSPPDTVIVGNFFPSGMLPPIPTQLKSEIPSLAQTDIGKAYSVALIHKMTDKLELFEFVITEL